MRATTAAVGAVLILAGCATQPGTVPERVDLPRVGKFSDATPGEVLPSGWQVWQIAGFKRPTEYRLVDYGGRTVVLARANSSASGLVYPIAVDLKEYPILRWNWKVPALIEGADVSRRQAEDSPARIVVTFHGDKSKLPLADRMFAEQFKLFTKHEFPYAVLMYIWENRAPVGAVFENPHTSRIRMIVADSGGGNVGAWREEVRNLYEDYRRAFGEEPPLTRTIGIMTDSDNTGSSAEAFYGDISFQRAQ